jgi:hypothetical protein
MFSCSLLRAEDLCVLYGSLRISKFAIFDPKDIKKSFTAVIYFLLYLVIKTLASELDPDPDPQCWVRDIIKLLI